MQRLRQFELAAEDVLREVEAEMDVHIRERADQLRASGMSPDRARDEAAARFGDRTQYLLESTAIVLATRLRQVHRRQTVRYGTLAATIVVVAVSIGLFLGVRRIKELSRSLAQTQTELRSYRGGSHVPLAQNVRFVTVRGRVAKPQVWTLPRGMRVTVGELIQKSGGLVPGALGRATITRYYGGQASAAVVITQSNWTNRRGDLELNEFATVELE